MDIHYLPDNLFDKAERSIQLYDYNIVNTCVKNKIVLTKNVLSFLVEGTKQLITHNTTTLINNQQFLLIKSGHCLMSENIAPSNSYRSMLLFFSDEAVLDFLKKYNINSAAEGATVPYHICNYDAYIHQFVASLKQIYQNVDYLDTPLLQVKFEEIMIYLIQKKGRAFLEHFLCVESDHVKHFKRVVESNTLNNLNLQELSFLCNMSLSTFKREFEKQYKESPKKWFVDKRLEHAAFLLITQYKRPIDIYGDIGFESLSSFTQSFKQKFGETPKVYAGGERMNF